VGEPGAGEDPVPVLARGRPQPAEAEGRGKDWSRAWSWARLLVFAAAVVLNVVVVFWPSPPAGAGQLFPQVDKVAHILVFAVVAWTGVRVPLPLVPLVGLLAAHAVESELVQHFLLTQRSGDALDAVADLAGVLLGLLLGLLAADRVTGQVAGRARGGS
jgi:hypothetical protein